MQEVCELVDEENSQNQDLPLNQPVQQNPQSILTRGYSAIQKAHENGTTIAIYAIFGILIHLYDAIMDSSFTNYFACIYH